MDLMAETEARVEMPAPGATEETAEQFPSLSVSKSVGPKLSPMQAGELQGPLEFRVSEELGEPAVPGDKQVISGLAQENLAWQDLRERVARPQVLENRDNRET